MTGLPPLPARPHLDADGCPLCQRGCPHYGTDPTRKGHCGRFPYQVIAAEQRVCRPVVAQLVADLRECQRRAGLLQC
jgi:hypothetical protein